MFSLWVALSLSARAGCSLDAPPDAPFTAAADAPRVQVLIELWVGGGEAEWAASILDALDSRGMPATIVVPVGEPSPALRPLLDRIHGSDHDLAVALSAKQVPTDKASAKALQQQVDTIAEVTGRIRTVAAPIGTRTSEALLGTIGFRSLVDTGGAPTAEPRMAGMFEGQPRVNVVLPSGPYQDACGTDPHASPFTPPAADRAAAAIARASRFAGTPIVRVALDGGGARPTDAQVLGRWLDEVIGPSRAAVVTAEGARAAVLRGFRNPDPTPVTADHGGRMVPLVEVRRAADALTSLSVLPRTLPGDLTPTEAFQAFVWVAAARTEGEMVRLAGLSGPALAAKSGLHGPTPFAASEVQSAAKGLAGELPAEIPAAFPVGTQLLTAGELLLALAGVVRGEDPVLVHPIASPEPNERGLGWGVSALE